MVSLIDPDVMIDLSRENAEAAETVRQAKNSPSLGNAQAVVTHQERRKKLSVRIHVEVV